MEARQIEFFVSPQGMVYFYGKNQEIIRYDMEQPELIRLMAQMIQTVYPEAYEYLFNNFIKSEKNKLYHQFLITERFIRCNFGNNDTLNYDINQGMMNLERVNCPLRKCCKEENIVCNPKVKSPFFPKETEVAKVFAKGYVASEVADILGKSLHTVTSQLRNMTRRLGLRSSREIIKIVHQRNLWIANIASFIETVSMELGAQIWRLMLSISW